jgi:hypothetical protein
MRRLIILAFAFLLSQPLDALAQIFDVPIPKIGRVQTQAGYTPGFGAACDPLGHFPPGDISTPFTTYVIIERNAPQIVDLAWEIRATTPYGHVIAEKGNRWAWNSTRWCIFKEWLNFHEFGIHRFHFFVNGVEVARLSLTIRPTN